MLKNISHIQLKNVSALIEKLRNIKSSQEQEYLIQASKIALNSLDSTLHNLTTEYTEIQLEAELMSEIIKNGGDWIYVKNPDTEKREFYRGLLARLAYHVLLKIK
ncbi:hypothetical protein ACJVVU_08070, partial [Staphylococcus coagulans]